MRAGLTAALLALRAAAASYDDPFRLTVCPQGEANATAGGGAICAPLCAPPYPAACPTELPAGFPSKPGQPPVAPVCSAGRCLLACPLPPAPSLCGPTACLRAAGLGGGRGACFWQHHKGDVPKPPPPQPPVFAVSVELGPEVVQPHLSAGPSYQFPVRRRPLPPFGW